MASFSDLPNEMVREVARHVMPEDIENFSLVSKRIYAVNLAFLEEHRELRERYSAFELLEKTAFDGRRLRKSPIRIASVTSNCASETTLSNLLIDILANGRRARYIKELRLDGWFLHWVYVRQKHIPYAEEHFVLFKQALSIYVLPTQLEKWVEELESGNEGPIVIERIKADCIPGIPILSHLERVNLQYNDYYQEADPRPIDFLAFLATMPSLKSLYGQAIATYGDAHDFSCVTPHSSNITDLGFKFCNISLVQLDDLLQGLKALQVFHYIYELYFEDLALERWDPAGMCKVLLKHAQGSLKILDLRSENMPIGPIESLQKFEVLKELTLSFPSVRLGAHFSSQTLASQLPKSIQKISLHDVDIKDIPLLKDTICEVVYLKPDRLPSLQKLCVCEHWGSGGHIEVASKLRNLCESAGLELFLMKQ